MPRWSTGRVALVGDAAHAPSFLSGQGTSTALVGAYVLAGELAAATDHAAAFAGYERGIRGFVAANQALAEIGRASIAPRTAAELALRNEALRAAARGGGRLPDGGSDEPGDLLGDQAREANSALVLPDYAAVP